MQDTEIVVNAVLRVQQPQLSRIDYFKDKKIYSAKLKGKVNETQRPQPSPSRSAGTENTFQLPFHKDKIQNHR